MAATTSYSAVAFGDGWRDRDPPPSFDGTEENFKQYIRDLKRWHHETDIPKSKCDDSQFSGVARVQCDAAFSALLEPRYCVARSWKLLLQQPPCL